MRETQPRSLDMRAGQQPNLRPDDPTQTQLFPVRLLTREVPPDGAHLAMAGRADDGYFYFCKDDRQGSPLRMREVVFSLLAREVGLPTPQFRIIEDEVTGETYFGSQRSPSTVNDVARKKFLRTERRDELGRYPDFPGRWFSQLHVLDLFVANWDRSAANLVAIDEGSAYRLCPIDFAAAELAQCEPDRFPVASTETVTVAKQLSIVHGFFADSGHQMLAKIGAVPPSVFASFFEGLPADWIEQGEREALCDFWSGKRLAVRIDALRSRLENGQVI